MTPFWLVVAALAAHRITRALVIDAVSTPAREWLILRMPSKSKVSQLIDCPHCLGAYVSLGVVLVLAGWGQTGRWILLAWAVAGAQSLLASLDAKLAD